MPLVYGGPGGTEWYRPHTHVTALAPVFSQRAIVHGTFTHPSPIASLIYRGDAGPGPVTRLAEQLDGRSLFGRPLESLAPETLNDYAERLGISVVVALDEDASRLRALDENRAFARRPAPAPFLIYVRREAVVLPRAVAPDRWTITLAADRDAWVSTRTAYYPLWRAQVQGAPIETRRGTLGDLEVRLGEGAGPRVVDLVYAAGVPGSRPAGAAGRPWSRTEVGGRRRWPGYPASAAAPASEHSWSCSPVPPPQPMAPITRPPRWIGEPPSVGRICPCDRPRRPR